MYGTTGPWVPGAALFVGARSACRSWHLRSSIREIYRRHCRLWCAYDTLPTRPRIRGENRREDPQRILSPKNLPQALALKLCSVSQTPRPVQMTPRRSPPSGVGDLNRKKAVFPYQRVVMDTKDTVKGVIFHVPEQHYTPFIHITRKEALCVTKMENLSVSCRLCASL